MINEDVNQKLEPGEIADLARQAGFTGYDLTVAVSVALAESGGNTGAYNPEIAAGTPVGQGSYGLWQVYSKMHPEFTHDQLWDPAMNAQAAFKVYSAAHNSFHPWSTFTGGAYKAHLEAAGQAVTDSEFQELTDPANTQIYEPEEESK